MEKSWHKHLRGHFPNPPLFEKLKERAKQEFFPILQDESASVVRSLLRSSSAKNVLEIGTGFGYSSCHLALGMLTGGELHLCDYHQHLLDDAKAYVAEVRPEIEVVTHSGKAPDSLEGVDLKFDLVFIDLDKIFYERAYHFALSVLADKGQIVFDNIYFSGRIFEENPQKKGAQCILRLLDALREDAEAETDLIDVGDGLLIVRKGNTT